MSAFLDACRFTATLGGTTDWTPSAAVTGYQTPSGAAAVSGNLYRYRAESSDLSQWEVGYGIWNGTSFLRTVVLFNSAGTTAKISFSAAPVVGIVFLAEDLSVPITPQGRLTLQTAVPVMTTTQSAKTTIYYTNFVGNKIPLYDGLTWVATDITSGEISVLTTDTTKSPAAIGASKVNDWFVWNDAGTVRLSHGPDWTNDTTRAAGTALVMVNGIYLNNASLTNGPAASRGTYVGTTRSNASSQLDWIFGGNAAGGTAAVHYVWNTYNRRPVKGLVTDSTSSWSNSAGSTRAADGSSTMRASFVVGLQEDFFSAVYNCTCIPATTSGSANIGIGYDSTSALATGSYVGWTSALSGQVPLNGGYVKSDLGAHFFQAIESSATTATTFYGSLIGQNGLAYEMQM